MHFSEAIRRRLGLGGGDGRQFEFSTPYLAQQMERIREQIESLKEQMERLESPEWKWLTTQYLPMESLRIALEAMALEPASPDWPTRMAVAAGQKAQNDRLIQALSDVNAEIGMLEREERKYEAAFKRAKEARG